MSGIENAVAYLWTLICQTSEVIVKSILVLIISFFLHSIHVEASDSGGPNNQSDYDLVSNFQLYVSEFAKQLFFRSDSFSNQDLVAVGSFLPVSDLNGDQVPVSSTFGLQLQESLMTLATQQGMGVIEYKTARDLNLGSRFDVMLSRDLEKLNDQFEVDYFLTGTYIIQSGGYLVNARLIEVKTRAVVAAATDFIPEIPGEEHVSLSKSRPNNMYLIR